MPTGDVFDGDIGSSITINLVGPFAMRGPLGEDLTPRGTKTCGIVLLLLSAPSGERARRWIEAKLWSTRSEEQASASLRTALSELRRVLGPYKDLVTSNRRLVRLDMARVKSDLLSGDVTATVSEILEGLDARDDEFEDWLREFRYQHAASSASAGDSLVLDAPLVAAIDAQGTRLEQLLANAILDQIGQNVDERVGIGLTESEAARTGGLIIRSSVVQEKDKAFVSLRLNDGRTRQAIWSRRLSLQTDDLDLFSRSDVLQLTYEATSAIIDSIPRLGPAAKDVERQAEVQLSTAIYEMFSFDAERFNQAERLLDSADALVTRPIFGAWRSLLLMFRAIENSHGDNKKDLAQAVVHADHALEADPSNSHTLAICSVVKLLLGGDVNEGYALARHALSRNRSNAIAYVGLNIALMRSGRTKEALAASKKARTIAHRSSGAHWIDMFCCLGAIAAEEFEQAILHGEAAATRAPKFRPPLRHLYALYLHRGDVDRAKEILSRLHELEPGFSLEKVRADSLYPASTLRSSRLIELPDLPGVLDQMR